MVRSENLRCIHGPAVLEAELWRLLIATPSCPTSSTWIWASGAHHFTEHLAPRGTRLLISGGPLRNQQVTGQHGGRSLSSWNAQETRSLPGDVGTDQEVTEEKQLSPLRLEDLTLVSVDGLRQQLAVDQLPLL